MTTINNVDVLRTVTVNQAVVDGFSSGMKAKVGHTLKQWPKAAGERPTDEMLTAAVAFSTQRKCGPESLFLAMQMRPNGASLAELAAAYNAGPAHNHTRDCERAGYLVRSKGGGRFLVTFTLKGQKALEKLLTATAAPAEATKAADKPKPKKAAKVAADKKPTSDAVKGNHTKGWHKGKKAKPDELSPDMMKAVEAELAERNAELVPEPVQPTDQQQA